MIRSNFIKYRLPALSVALAIFIQSSLSKIPTLSLGFRMQDKLLHAIVYGILGFLTARAFYFKTSESIKRNAFKLSFITVFLFAISDEIHQSFVPGRSAEFGDLIADLIGMTLAQIIFFSRLGIAPLD